MSEQYPPSGDQPATPPGAGGPPPPPYGSQPASDPYGSPPPATPPAYGAPPPAYGAPPPAYGATPPDYGSPQSGYPGAQPPYGQPAPYGGHPGGAFPFSGKDPDKRPGTVLAGCIIAIVFSALAMVGSLILLVMATASRDEAIQAIEDNPRFDSLDMSAADLIGFLRVFAIVLVVWSLVAIVLAIWAMRRSNVGRILLVVSAALAAVLSLLSMASGFPLLWTIASIATIALVFSGGANAWYAGRGGRAQAYQQPPAW